MIFSYIVLEETVSTITIFFLSEYSYFILPKKPAAFPEVILLDLR